jgi:molecular chaperone GrpE
MHDDERSFDAGDGDDDAIEIEFVDTDEEVAGSADDPPAEAAELVDVPETREPDGAALRRENERLRVELDQLRDHYLRKLAEFDNFRKRTEREREEFQRTAGEKVVRELVPVLDNFERALSHADESDAESFRQGVDMIARQLWEVLERQGLEVVDPTGQPFEPEFHEAVQRVEDGSHAPGTVVWVLAKGYLFGGRLLRPAMVGVAVEPTGSGVTNSPHEGNGPT